MSENKLKIWDPKFIKDGLFFSCIISGSRRSGKSTMIKSIYNKCKLNKVYDFVIIFSTSPDTLEYYGEFVKGDLFFKQYDPEIIRNIMNVSGYYKQKNQPKKFLIIFDDSISNEEKASEDIQRIYTQGRHHNISIIWSTQKLSMISTTCRCNTDFILFGLCKSAMEKKAIIENYLTGTCDEEQMAGKSEINFYRNLLKDNTINYNFLVIDYTDNTTNDFYDTVFNYRADIEKKK